MTSAPRIFELRTYRSERGTLDQLSRRFLEHTDALFARHGIDALGYFITRDDDDPTTGLLVYLCAYDSREAAEHAWSAFREDPEWIAAKAASEADGPLVERIDSLFMAPTEYSEIR